MSKLKKLPGGPAAGIDTILPSFVQESLLRAAVRQEIRKLTGAEIIISGLTVIKTDYRFILLIGCDEAARIGQPRAI